MKLQQKTISSLVPGESVLIQLPLGEDYKKVMRVAHSYACRADIHIETELLKMLSADDKVYNVVKITHITVK